VVAPRTVVEPPTVVEPVETTLSAPTITTPTPDDSSHLFGFAVDGATRP
jgi:hypothetical protein